MATLGLVAQAMLAPPPAAAAPPVPNANSIISCQVVDDFATLLNPAPLIPPTEQDDPVCEALIRIEAAATAEVIRLRGLTSEPAFVRVAARTDVTALMWASISDAIVSPPAERTADEQLVVDWMTSVWRNYQRSVIDAALAEHAKWDTPGPDGRPGACTYTPPEPAQNEYPGEAGRWAGCFTGGIFDLIGSSPAEPSFEEFMRWGSIARTNQLAGAMSGSALTSSMLISLASGVGSGLALATPYTIAMFNTTGTAFGSLVGQGLLRAQNAAIAAGGRAMAHSFALGIGSRVVALGGGVAAIVAAAVFILVQRVLDLFFTPDPAQQLRDARTNVLNTTYDLNAIINDDAQAPLLFQLFIASLDPTIHPVTIPARAESDFQLALSEPGEPVVPAPSVQVDDWAGNPQTIELRSGYVRISAPGEEPFLATSFPALDADGEAVQVHVLRDENGWRFVAVPVGRASDCFDDAAACDAGASIEVQVDGVPHRLQIIEPLALTVGLVGSATPLELDSGTWSLDVRNDSGTPVPLSDIRWEAVNTRDGNLCRNVFGIVSRWYDTPACRVEATGPALSTSFDDPGEWLVTVSGLVSVSPELRITRVFALEVQNRPPTVEVPGGRCAPGAPAGCESALTNEGQALVVSATVSDGPFQVTQLELVKDPGATEVLATTPIPCRPPSPGLTIDIFARPLPDCTADVSLVESPAGSGRYQVTLRAQRGEPDFPVHLLLRAANPGGAPVLANLGTQSGWMNLPPVVTITNAPTAATAFETVEITGTVADPGGTTAITAQLPTLGLFTGLQPLPTLTPNGDGTFSFRWVGQVPVSASGNVAYDAFIFFRFLDPQGLVGSTFHRISVSPIADTTPPVVTLEPPATASGWFGPATDQLGWNVSDPQSPVTLLSPCSPQVSLPPSTGIDGISLTCTARSFGGTTTVTETVRRDSDPPVLSVSGGPIDGATYPTDAVPPAPTCTADDALSGVDADGCVVEGWSDEPGSQTVTIRARDLAGNEALVETVYNVSGTPGVDPVITPTVTGTLGRNGWYVSGLVTVSWTVDDPTGSIVSTTGCDPIDVQNNTQRLVVECSVTNANGTFSASVVIKKASTPPFGFPIGGPELRASYPVSAVPPAPTNCGGFAATPTFECVFSGYSNEVGEQAFWLTVTDEAGNTFEDVYAYSVFDDSPPEVEVDIDGELSELDDQWYTSDVTVTFTVTEPHTPVEAEGCDPVSITEDTVSVELQCRATSGGGQTVSPMVLIRRDATPPMLVLNGEIVDGAIYPSPLDVPEPFTCDVIDLLSGPAGCGIDGYSAEPGSHTLTAWGTDIAGNRTERSFTYFVERADDSPPDIDAVVNPAQPASGWQTTDVELTWLVTDPENLVRSTTGCEPFLLTTDSAGTDVTCSATSAGGTGTRTVTLRRDTTPPVLTVLGGPADGADYLPGELPAPPSCRVTDASSGVGPDGCVVGGYSSAVGTHTITFQATDVAGNTATRSVTYTVVADTTPPVVSVAVDGPMGNDDWFTGDATVTWSTTDDESAVSVRQGCDPIVIDTDGISELTCLAVSAGGGTTGSVEVKRDATAPELTIIGGPAEGAVYAADEVPPAPECEAVDTTSGVAEPGCTVSGYSTAGGDHTITVSASDVAGNTVTRIITYSVLATAPPVSVELVGGGTVTEDTGRSVPARFRISLPEASTTAVRVSFRTEPGTADQQSDYRRRTGTAVFRPGITSLDVVVQIVGDNLDEDDETFEFIVTRLDATENATATAVATIIDDDPEPVVGIGPAIVVEGNSGTADLQIPVTLNRASGRVVTVQFTTADGTATAPGDYTPVAVPVVFPAGTTRQLVAVPVVGDTDVEPDETIDVTLSDPVNAVLGTATATATIVDDDGLPSLTVADASVVERNRGLTRVLINVSLSRPASDRVVVAFATADGTATAPADYLKRAGLVTFNPGQTTKRVIVPVRGDTLVEGDEFFNVFLTLLQGPVEILDGQATVTIIDND